jgi:hypothetical protein
MWGCIFSPIYQPKIMLEPMPKLDAHFHHIMSTQIPLDTTEKLTTSIGQNFFGRLLKANGR